MRAEQRRDRDPPRWAAARSRWLRLPGWLAAGSLLVHGWLPILLQVSLLTSEPDGHSHHAGTAAPATAPAGKSPQCPLFHTAICLCATFAKLLPASRSPAVATEPVCGARRQRSLRPMPPRQPPRLPFEARAPPVSA